MQIESLGIKNYRLFRDTRLEVSPCMAVVAGANARRRPRRLTAFHVPYRGGRGVRNRLDSWFSRCGGARWPISPSTDSVLCRRPGAMAFETGRVDMLVRRAVEVRRRLP